MKNRFIVKRMNELENVIDASSLPEDDKLFDKNLLKAQQSTTNLHTKTVGRFRNECKFRVEVKQS